MKTQRQHKAGTMGARSCRADLSRRSETKAEALRRRGAVCTGEIIRARANGFPPRSFVSGETID